MTALPVIEREVVSCQRCPRLVAYREEVARVKRRAYRDEDYWGRPVPGFGDAQARLLIIGLAPAAHGANRTGRMFTGDRSGDWLYRALHETGFASQAHSVSRHDGLILKDAFISAAVRCAPPDNKPSRTEMAACRGYLEHELAALSEVRVVVALGRIAFNTYLGILQDRSEVSSRATFPFAHGAEFALQPVLLASYHPSQQNTSTGRLTAPMLLSVFARARAIVGSTGC